MTVRPFIILSDDETRAKAASWCWQAPLGSVVSWREQKRTDEQSDKLHAMCGDVSKQVKWFGRTLDKEAWKDIFTAALRTHQHKLEIVPGIHGGFVMLGMHTSRMTVEEVSDLIELIYMFGADHGVIWSDPKIIRENPRDVA